MALTSITVDRPEELDSALEAWDALAVATQRPYCAPAWMLAWWRHAAPATAGLRVVLVFDGTELVGLGPFFFESRRGRAPRHRVLAAGTSHRVEPLALPGRERDVARQIAEALAHSRPRPRILAFESVDAAAGWTSLIADAWPGRPAWRTRDWSGPAPTLALDGAFSDWLASKSRNFRDQAKRLRRRLEARGATFRVTADPSELPADIAAFAQLHHARWRSRGGSKALDCGVERMLVEAGRDLLGQGRFRVVVIDGPDGPISAHVFLAAGGEVTYWNGGFDEDWASEQPAMRALVAAIEDAFGRGDRRLDFGGGTERYKYRMADGEDLLESTLVVPRDARYPLTRLGLLPRRVGRGLVARTRDRVRPPGN